MVSKAIDEGLLERIQSYVSNDINSKLPPGIDEKHKTKSNQVYIVQFSRILNNWQALCSVEEEVNCYYALTHDGDSEKTIVRVFALRSLHEAVI